MNANPNSPRTAIHLPEAAMNVRQQAEEFSAELRQKEQDLRAAQAAANAILEQMSDGFVTFDREWRYTRVNQAAAKALHLTPEQLLGRTLWEAWPAAFDLPLGAHFRRSLQENIPLQFETFYPAPLNRWFECRCYPVPDGLATFFSDITERKRTEDQLRELSQRLTYHVDNSPLGVIEWGPDMRLIRWSGEAERIFGWKAEEVLGKQMEDFRWIYEADRPQIKEIKSDLLAGINPQSFSANRNYRKDGSIAYCEWYNSTLVDESGKVRSVLSLVLDVTKRKQAEERLKDSLREQEVLLKEIHHRVKNNLQVISSLVGLQADALEDPTLRGLFHDVRDRVRSMALVHEKLYQSPSLARVEFGEYARSLLHYLWRAHADSAGAVQLVLDLQPVMLTVEQAVPGGLMLNELATNALKHAFRGRSAGEITVALYHDSDDRVCLRVRDNGVGLPAGLDWRRVPSLGLRLVQMLARQLNGTVEVRTGAGTEFLLVFGPSETQGR